MHFFLLFLHFLNIFQYGSAILENTKVDGSIPFRITQQKFYYVNITIPNDNTRTKCTHCNVERCNTLQFCYSILYSSSDRSVGDYCADENEMYSLVGAQLDATTSSHGRKRRRIHEKCLKSINDDNLFYCVCETVRDAATKREYEDLRKIRIWRYQSLIVHDELMNTIPKSTAVRTIGQVVSMIILFLMKYDRFDPNHFFEKKAKLSHEMKLENMILDPAYPKFRNPHISQLDIR